MKTKFRHRVVYVMLRPLFKVFLKVRFNFQFERFDESTIPGPYLIVGNHTQNLDPVFLALSFQKPIYFVASSMVFNLPVISSLLKYLVAPIPIEKFRSDVKSAKLMLKTLKAGAHVCVFPEGNTSYSGQTGPIDISIAKLAKTAQVPLVFYNLHGGFLTRPRWALNTRKGLLRGAVKTVLMPEEIASLSLEALHEIIIENCTVNDYEIMKKHRYQGKNKGLGAESAFYYCPHCQSFDSLHSQQETIFCETCDFKVDVNDYGKFENLFSGTYFDTPIKWMNAQEEALKVKIHQTPSDDIIFKDESLELYEIRPSKPKLKIGTVQISLNKNTFFIQGSTLDWAFSNQDLQVAIQMRNNLIIHDKKSHQTYYLIPPKHGNSLKYVQTIEFVQKGV